MPPRSTVTLAASAICFLAGAAIFIIAFVFKDALEPRAAGAAGVVLIILFIPLAYLGLHFKYQENEAEQKAEEEKQAKKAKKEQIRKGH